MRYAALARAVVSFALAACLLASPAAVLAKKGEKNYKRGLEHEAAQQWEKAAEEFALAVAAAPNDTEYQLHYRRAVFNASQVYMQKGRALAQQEEYAGAFQYFRMAFDLDPVNGLAAQEMERMLRLRGEKEAAGRTRVRSGEQGGAVSPAAYVFKQNDARSPEGAEKLRNINYNSDLKKFIRMLASEVGLNVLFDTQTFRTPRNVEVVLQDVTAARALDHVFLQEGLFFQSVDRRTILVADQGRRPQYQQLVIRTFYLTNADPADAQRLIQQAVPPQQGRQATVIPNKATNSVTVRDTAENMRLIGEVLRTIDKERAEVVLDVKIYEVSRNDLMQFGNQLGTSTSLTSLGGTGGLAVLGGSREAARAVTNAATAFGAALVIPTSTLNAWQQKDRTRILAATQLHAFDGEKSQAHIGKKVPVQTAQVYTGATATGGTGTNNGTTTTGVYGTTGYPVIQYQDTGLTLDFTPQIFPNGDVQVKMSITSNDAVGTSLTPTFSERTLSGTARVQDGRTMMIASISQQLQSRQKSGLPLLGLVPVLGRLFTAPTNSDVQTDIVVAVTPHVLRAPAITPFDERTRPSGSMQSPQPESLEAMLREEGDGRGELAADAPPAQAPAEAEQMSYLPAPKGLAAAAEADGVKTFGSREAALPAGDAARAVPAADLSPASWELTVKPERQELNRFFTPGRPNPPRPLTVRGGKR
ncbi:MAG TPA: secretin N-terminal domain-containing protein [Pyrinomonadaceae bacterium]|nr:secretin N-terminal domain-containing protein [Pyrinomonadaceae bacterium]